MGRVLLPQSRIFVFVIGTRICMFERFKDFAIVPKRFRWSMCSGLTGLILQVRLANQCRVVARAA